MRKQPSAVRGPLSSKSIAQADDKAVASDLLICNGAATTTEILVSTTTNQGPLLTTLSAQPTIVARGKTIDLTAEAIHPDECGGIDTGGAEPCALRHERDSLVV